MELPETIERITLAISPGIQAAVALTSTLSLARGFGSNLRVVTLDNGQVEREELVAWSAEIRETILDEFDGQRLETEVVETENIIESLLFEADLADLFVMGSSRDWVDKNHLLGMIPDQVVNRCKTTVVVAKQEETRLRSLFRRLFNLVHPSG